MVTEEMVQRALAGEKVYFVDTEGTCVLLWMRGRSLRLTPQLERFCEE